MTACSNVRCDAPVLGCYLGERTLGECPFWKERKEAPPEAKGTTDGKQSLLPWTGSALGSRDLTFLTGRGEAKLVALMGAHNAGKTTLLASWYQHVGRTGHVDGRGFSGSFTLEGWEAVAHALRWDGSVPRFPPHTPAGGGRAPGMLHLALRDAKGALADYLFADSPGEWFQRWATESAATDAEGARWLVERASVLIVVADCEALSGPDRGTARSDLKSLLQRTADHHRGRPVALVWAKADIPVTAAIRSAVTETALQAIPDIVQFHASITDFQTESQHVHGAASVREVLEWALQPMQRGFEVTDARIETRDPFFRYGSLS
ncbi:TRAFAC clade GTPase domain-containing protein [Devosia sp. Leaf420]|uniref:TRAFAC clade GTPase domain-containing protein n=1 Tax=Devosia sp. Leaf420 TaxID=1736374 RepID=UPI00078174C7|nr:hypothetical protein [Devosia sp. Leaf420]